MTLEDFSAFYSKVIAEAFFYFSILQARYTSLEKLDTMRG